MTLFFFTLVIMLALTIFSMITGNNLITATMIDDYTYISQINGTSTSYTLPYYYSGLQFDPIFQAIIWITIIAGIAVASSLTILGSGLGAHGAHWLAYSIFYVSLWMVLSGLAYPLIISINTIGILLYLLLTMLYAIGCIIKIGEHD